MAAPDRRAAFILLAAGRSRRFGSDKLSAQLRGRPLWQWAAKAAEEAGFADRYLVTGTDASSLSRRGWTRVPNGRAEEGIGTSIAAGAGAAAHHGRIVIALADAPLIAPDHLLRLAQSEHTVFTRQADGSPGSPAAFRKQDFDALKNLEGDRGASSLTLPDARTIEPPSYDMLADIDTPSQLSALSRDVSGQLS